MLHIIIPTRNSAADLAGLLSDLGAEHIIISDSQSEDDTRLTALQYGARIAVGAPGRGRQLRRGAHLATLSGGEDDWFLFLHADCRLLDGWRGVVERAIAEATPRYFRFRAHADGLGARMMEGWVGLRCAVFGLPYGDQGLLVSRADYVAVGGYREYPLFEDVDLVDRLRKQFGLRALPIGLRTDVSTHHRQGYWRRGLRNLSLLLRYRMGASPHDLAKRYR